MPLFSLSYTAKGFCVKDCEKEEQATVALALQDISYLTWKELKSASRRGLGYANIYSINKTIPEIAVNKQPIAFRMGKFERFISFRERQAFYIIWIYTKGEVYKH